MFEGGCGNLIYGEGFELYKSEILIIIINKCKNAYFANRRLMGGARIFFWLGSSSCRWVGNGVNVYGLGEVLHQELLNLTIFYKHL